jgi:16S rRNA (adenine1518-N6/adenine1519-N6)-dimethyltransferase
LTSPRQKLKALGLRPKKTLGQNFLQDPVHLSAIADAVRDLADPAHPWAVEIGLGTGVLTRALLDRGLLVHGVEKDERMVEILKADFAADLEEARLDLFEGDAMRVQWRDAFAPRQGARGVLCGNLPYQLSSNLLVLAAENAAFITGAVFLLQKEVVERVVAEPGTKAYGVVGIFVQARFEAEYLRTVPAGAFWPPPKVESAVVAMRPRAQPQDAGVDWAVFKKVVKTAFSQRRKTLRNTLKNLLSADDLSACEVDPSARAETLAVADFVRLARVLEEKGA